mmetsp:Transcript_102631/g.162040  ORF Transcript_102631/g.162040 Transcript_102631/m.162040 type:complete len:372 (-) Transcript_102631:161-1276(-)
MAPKRKSMKNSSVAAVVNTLTATEALPADLRSLLKSTLPLVLDTNKADRHAFEAEIVDKAGESLSIAQKACEAEHKAALAKQTEVVSPAERTKRDAAKKDAEAKMNAAHDTVSACDNAKKTADSAVEDAESGLKSAQKDEKDAGKVKAKTLSTKDSLTAAINVHFAALMEGTFAKPALKKAAVAAVVKMGKDHAGVGNTLSQAFALACNTDAAARSQFETTTFTTVKTKLDAALETISKQLVDETAVEEQKMAATAAAKETLDKAKETLSDAETKLAAAKEAQKEAKKAFSQAVAFRHKVWADMRSACDAQDELAEALKQFKEVIFPAFEELKEKTPPPPPPAEPEEPAEEPPEKRQRTEEEAAESQANAD